MTMKGTASAVAGVGRTPNAAAMTMNAPTEMTKRIASESVTASGITVRGNTTFSIEVCTVFSMLMLRVTDRAKNSNARIAAPTTSGKFAMPLWKMTSKRSVYTPTKRIGSMIHHDRPSFVPRLSTASEVIAMYQMRCRKRTRSERSVETRPESVASRVLSGGVYSPTLTAAYCSQASSGLTASTPPEK